MQRRRERILLIDGHSLAHRAYYALPLLTTAGGVPTNAVYGCAAMLLRFLEEERPGAAAAAFDPSGPTFRREAEVSYKANRHPPDAGLRVQLPHVEELFSALGIPVFKVQGYEADDVLGTLARQAEAWGMDVLVLTGDKDLLQLVTGRVEALILRRGVRDVERFDEEAVVARLGVRPEQIADVKGLAGEASDNIPGVPGIGMKRAVRLVRQFGSAEEVLSRLEEVGGKTAAALKAHRAQVLQSKWLATIDTHVPLEVQLEGLRYHGPDVPALKGLLCRLECRSLLESLEERYPWLMEKGRRRGGAALRPANGPAPEKSRVIPLQAIEEVAQEAVGRGPLALGFVVDGPARTGSPLGLWCAHRETCWYVPLSGEEEESPALARFFERLSGAHLVVYDAKAQAIVAGRFGILLPEIGSDVKLAGYLLAPGQGDSSLEDLSLKYLHVEAPPLPTGERGKAHSLRLLPAERLADWAARRASLILRLEEVLLPKLGEEEMLRLYEEVELPLARVLAEMELRGVAVDVALLQTMSRSLEREIEAIEARVYEAAGEAFNINSPRQLAAVLFERLGLPVLKKGKSGPSTSAQVLEALAEEHEIAALLLEHRRLQKLKGTYVDALPGLVDPATGRIHTTFHQAVTATGRLSSANPNLQNIPVRSSAAREIRRAFVAPHGYVLLCADYSQVELRLLAHLSGDERLIEAFVKGEDIHARTASEIFGVAQEAVTPAQREAAKAVNFGIVYGISSFGLSQGARISREEAQRFIDAYFDRHPGVARFVEACIAQGREKGYVSTLMGRRRYLPELRSRRHPLRKAAERAAVNSPVQGSAADVIKAAMIALERRLRLEGLDAHLVLQVHDELLVEVRSSALREAARAVKESMEGAARLSVPLVVALKAGPTWYDAARITL